MTTCGYRWFPSGFKEHFVHLVRQSLPIALTHVNLMLFSYISLPFIGRLDKTQMSALALGKTTIDVFVTSITIGLFTACETLVSQAFGEKQFEKVSMFCQQSVWIGLLASAPMIAVIMNAGCLFRLLGQKEDVIKAAESYIICYAPAIPISMFHYMLMKFLNCQFIVWPCVIFGLISNAINVGLHYAFITILGAGIKGAALSVILTNLVFTFSLLGFVIQRGLHKDYWHGFSSEALLSCGAYLELALSGMVMICLQFWAFEVGMVCCALMSQADLSVNLVITQLESYTFFLYSGVSTASSISIGNALGSGDADKAKTLSNISFTISLVLGCFFSTFFVLARKVIPLAFTSLPEIIKMVTDAMPIATLFVFVDALAVVANGVLRGCGRQKLGAIINLIGYYFLSLPIGISLTLPWGAGLGVRGYWMGQCLAQTVLSIILLTFQFRFVKWAKEVDLARERLSSEKRKLLSRRKKNAVDVQAKHRASRQTSNRASDRARTQIEDDIDDKPDRSEQTDEKDYNVPGGTGTEYGSLSSNNEKSSTVGESKVKVNTKTLAADALTSTVGESSKVKVNTKTLTADASTSNVKNTKLTTAEIPGFGAKASPSQHSGSSLMAMSSQHSGLSLPNGQLTFREKESMSEEELPIRRVWPLAVCMAVFVMLCFTLGLLGRLWQDGHFA